MREERDNIDGDYVVTERTTLWGTVTGEVTVVDGGKLWGRGLIVGDVIVKPGGRAHLFGTISGNVEAWVETKVIVSGTVGKDAINHGGRLYIDKSADIMGRVITHSGDTRINGVKQ